MELQTNIIELLKKTIQGLSKAEILMQYKAEKAKKKIKTAAPAEHLDDDVAQALTELCESGQLVLRKGKYVSTKKLGLLPATVVKVKQTFGYASLLEEEGKDVFIPGRFLKASLPGEVVLVRKLKDLLRPDSDSYEVIEIIKPVENYEFVGTVVSEFRKLCVLPDKALNMPIQLLMRKKDDYHAGEKVTARIIERGERHSDLRATILKSYGNSEKASVCVNAIIDSNHVEKNFPAEVLECAQQIAAKQITEKQRQSRVDLRNDIIFTIDSAESKDLDDAVSLTCLGDVYQLGVHIADVSHYVRQGEPVDLEAYKRGTSIYYANKVIPMLPPSISNGICSLNPHEDRLAFSALLTVSKEGKLLDFDFQKSVINSRVKGVYSEINSILNHSAEASILDKYQGLTDTLFQMEALADILAANKRERGAPDIDKVESKLIIDENDCIVDIVARMRGKSEMMIEEFMLLANQAAAAAAGLKEVPFVYRVHEPPSPEKVEALHDALTVLGINAKAVKLGMSPKVLSDILQKAKERPDSPVISNLALRSLSKARYSETPIGHYGLVLEDYAHFTSPIRRYPDLTIHRILGDLVRGKDLEAIRKKYKTFVARSAKQSSDTEIIAMTVERKCEDCYKAEYMKSRIGEEYDAQISSVMGYGFFVELPNTIEGLIRTARLPMGEYELENPFILREVNSNRRYKVGDAIRVRCTAVNVSAGTVDFDLISQ